MKKTLLFAAALFAANYAMAQNSNTINQTDLEGNNKANQAYVTQAGANTSVINQTLKSNNSAINDNIVNVSQVGYGNQSHVMQEAQDGHSSIVDQNGNNNIANVDLYKNRNSSYIQQTGLGSNVADQFAAGEAVSLTIDQQGYNNKAYQAAGGENDPNWHNLGTGNVLSNIQTGNSNYSEQSILNHGSAAGAPFSSVNNKTLMTQTGDGNQGYQRIGENVNGFGGDPDGNQSILSQNGNNNYSLQVQKGDNNYSQVTQNQNGNSSTINQLGDGATAIVTQGF